MEQLELTPVDVRHKEFSTGLAGYKKEEVREFLELVAHQMEDLQGRCTALAEEKKHLEEARREPEATPEAAEPAPEVMRDAWERDTPEPEPAPEPEPEPEPELKPEPEPVPVPEPEHKPTPTEDLISRTLILAEKTRQEILDRAESDAGEILAKAQEQAKHILEEARGYLQVLEDQYTAIKGKKKEFLAHFRDELQDLIDSLSRETLLRPELEHALDEQFAALHGDEHTPVVRSVESDDERPPFGID